MKNTQLILPTEQYLQSYLEACHEFKKNNITGFSFHDPDKFNEWKDTIFLQYENDRNGINLESWKVPSTAFWLVENGEFIGMGNIRHRLTENLERFGGHIGYAIRCSKWNSNYGTLLLKFLLQEAAKLGIYRVLITCDKDNIGSACVMEKNDGIYQDTIDNVIDGKLRLTKRYWFDIAEPKDL